MTDSTPPSTTSVAIAVGLVAITAGYFVGQGSNIGLFGTSGNPKQPPGKSKSWPNSYDVTIHPDSSDEELMAQQRAGAGATAVAEAQDSETDDEGDGKELKSFADKQEEVKLVLAVRTDLGMGKGRDSPTMQTYQACTIRLIACFLV
jgi:peptidyl-tRNA hydrolase, PTH2 family